MSKFTDVVNIILGKDSELDIIETAAHSTASNPNIMEFMKSKLDEDEYSLLQKELSTFLEETSIDVPPSFFDDRAEGDFYYDRFTGREFRPSNKLSFDIVERMLKSGVVMFPLEMKRAQIMHVFRNPRKWKVVCSNDKLQKAATANLRSILPKMADEFTFSAMVYGAAFGETTARLETEDQLGIPILPGPKRFWTVFDVPQFINPTTVKHIKRTARGKFDGFVQIRRNTALPSERIVSTDISVGQDIDITVENALVIPYQDKFSDLWGHSFFKTMYPYWFWFEVVTRSMVRYMERMSSPVVVARAPSRRKVRIPGTDKLQDAMLWALGVAKDISTSNAAVLPSDLDPQTEKPLWSMEYLTAPERAQNFKDVLELLQELMFRAAFTGDRSFTQSSGGIGSNAQAEVHAEATTVHNEMLLISFLWYLNTFFMPKYSLLNLGLGGPPIHLETVGLSSRERVLMTKLLNTAGNSAVVQEFFHIVDWRTLAEDEGIPTFTEEEVNENKKRLLNEALEEERRRLKLQGAEGSTDSETGSENPFAQSQEDNGDNDTEDIEDVEE